MTGISNDELPKTSDSFRVINKITREANPRKKPFIPVVATTPKKPDVEFNSSDFFYFMAFKKVKGKSLMEYWPKTASTTLTNGYMARAASGTLTVAAETSLSLLGVIKKTITSTDSDFAGVTKIPVEVPLDDCEFEADVVGTLTTAMVGELRGLKTAGDGVDAANTTNDQVLITAFISSSKCRCKINEAAQYADGA